MRKMFASLKALLLHFASLKALLQFASLKALFQALFLFSILIFSNLHASQSIITEAEGYACMGEDRSRRETRELALIDAKKNAASDIITYIKRETRVEDFEIEKDIIDAYSKATVKVLETKESAWYRDEYLGECFKVKIKAEVIPDEKAIKDIANISDNPNMPLRVSLWTDKKEYKSNDKIKIYIKGNKPFYLRILYKDAKGGLLQLLPNPYRVDNYFNGNVVYEIPSGNDRFELEVGPPFGYENIIVYASTSQLGDIKVKAKGGVYKVRTKAKDIGKNTRGVKLKEKVETGELSVGEFFEDKIVVKTVR